MALVFLLVAIRPQLSFLSRPSPFPPGFSVSLVPLRWRSVPRCSAHEDNINPHKIASQCTRASSRPSSGPLSVAARCSDDSSRPPSVLVPFRGSLPRSELAAVERHAPAGILECPPKVTRYSGVASPSPLARARARASERANSPCRRKRPPSSE